MNFAFSFDQYERKNRLLKDMLVFNKYRVCIYLTVSLKC